MARVLGSEDGAEVERPAEVAEGRGIEGPGAVEVSSSESVACPSASEGVPEAPSLSEMTTDRFLFLVCPADL